MIEDDKDIEADEIIRRLSKTAEERDYEDFMYEEYLRDMEAEYRKKMEREYQRYKWGE